MRITLTALALVLAACGETVTQAPETAPAENTESSTEVTEEQVAEETAAINTWFDEKYEEQLQFSPIQLTFLGRDERKGEIDDMSIEAQDEQLEWMKKSVEEMESTFDYDKLSPEAKISYDIWKYQYDQAAAGVEYRYNGFTFDQMNGVQSFFPTLMIQFHTVETEADMEAYISRISQSGRALDQLLEHAEEASSRGVVTPGFALEGVIDQSRKVITGAPFTEGDPSALWADVEMEITNLQSSGAIDEARATELREQARAALVDIMMPAYERLIEWAEGELEKAPAEASGVGSQPNGEAYYNYSLSSQTTTDLTAEEIHQIGLDEVDRIHAEMEAIKDQVGFEGTLKEFFAELRENTDNEKYYYPDTDEGRQAYIDDATAAIENIKKELPNYFGILPKADLEVKRVEAFREQPGAAQHYFPGTPDGSRPGIYYAHLSDMKSMPKRELEVIAYHEGIPGHHMQISIAQELQDIPQFRTQAGFTAYAEGWGLYSEWLAKEMPNTYQDPYSDFGRLGSELWRAIRLVVDTGLHSKGWTEEEAYQYFIDNAAVTPGQARSEIQRYIVMPGQATSYKIGMLKIQELRRKAEAELGDDFDIKGFHDTVLGGGSLPLTILERRVDTWIADQKAS
mgnify:CR=1 FL=1